VRSNFDSRNSHLSSNFSVEQSTIVRRSHRFIGELRLVRRERIFYAFRRGSGNSALPVRVLGQLLCRNCSFIDLITDIWYWMKTMEMER